MKRKILSLLLSFTLCLTLLPMAAFAEEPDKISITTVDELLQFAKAVDNGEYDDKTDAVVSLETNCQGLFNQIHKKATKKCQKQILAPDTFADGLFAPA